MKIILSNDLSPMDTALALLEQGLWPTVLGAPGRPKHPIGDTWWRRRPTEGELRDLFAGRPDAGVGTVMGRAAGIIDLDVDAPQAWPWLHRLFPGGVPATLSFTARRGPHFLFEFDERLAPYRPIFRLDGLEIRLGADKPPGAEMYNNVTVPTTPRPDGSRRQWIGAEILRLPESFFGRLADCASERERLSRLASDGETPPPGRP